jgi:hypothetical protein
MTALRLVVAAAFTLILGLPAAARAHEIGIERLLLRPELGRRELYGQLTLDPHRTRPDPTPGSPGAPNGRAASAVVALLERALVLEVDGSPCRVEYEVRELWTPGAPAPGDTVMLRCKLPPSAARLRVFVDTTIDPLAVTIQSARRGDDVETHSVLIRGGSFTPVYTFGKPAGDWRSGGADQFEVTRDDPPASTSLPAVRVSESREEARAPRGFEDEGWAAQARRYLVLGFEHIVPKGLDHVLFVASLVLGAGSRLRRLAWQLSVFTAAHTVTLALSASGWLTAPARFVEPLIALSIAAVAIGNVRPHAAPRARLPIVFAFGLLHGLGFASALSETGISGGALAVSLLSFNAGVELGQIVVVAVLLGAIALLTRLAPRNLRGPLHDRAVRFASLGVAGVGICWAVERVLA